MRYDKEIQDYLDGRLSPDEEDAFRKRLSADQKLKELFEEYLALNKHLTDYYKRKEVPETGNGEEQDLARESIADYEKAELEGDLPTPDTERFSQRLRLIEREFHKAYSRKDEQHRRKFIYWMAAALLVAIAGSYWLVFSRQDPGMYMFTQNYQPVRLEDHDYESVRGARDRQLLELYQDRAYDEMIASYESLGSDDPFVQYLLAHAYMATAQYDSAKAVLNSLQQGQEKLQSDIHWNMALLALRDEEWSRAASHLETLVETGGDYAPGARKLLRKVIRKMD